LPVQVIDLAMALRSEALLPGIVDLEQQLHHRLQADGCALLCSGTAWFPDS
jgi:hypothetical protein